MPPRTAPESLLPLKPVDLLVLAMLSAGDRHGYGIRRTSSSTPEARSRSRPATSIARFAVSSRTARRRIGPATAGRRDDERRRYYRLTPFGRRVLAAELERVRELVRLGEASDVIRPLTA